LDFVGTFSNRWSYGIAFGATANKVMFLFSEGYQPLQVPQWAQAFVLLIGGIEVGLSYFPFFACLSSEFRLLSSILGFCYSLIWFVVTIVRISQCPHGQFVGRYEALLFNWPSLLCLAFLLGRFLHLFVKALRAHLGWEPQAEEKPLLEVHQAKHVKQLLRKACPQERKKSWFQTRVYDWDPCFQFPSRMIGTIVLAFICLYLFIIIEFCMFVYVRDELDVFEGKLESYDAFMNQTGTLTPTILQVKELISVSKGYLIIHVMQSLCGLMIMYGLVLPVTHHRGLEMLRGLGVGILTISIVVGLMILQVWIAASFFLQPKLGPDDQQKPLALNNRKAFHNFNYFLFFYNVLLGLGACLSRLLISCILGTWLIARIDRTIMQSGYEGADMGFSAWIGMLYMDHYHTNPVLVSFCHLLITSHRERKLKKSVRYWCLDQSAGPRISARSRTRWFLLQTLINNPRLVMLRKSKSGHGSWELPRFCLTCSES
ncbi:Coiled-coil domain-containing protein 180, partial [Sciurus carolinensis]|nr:Coiled-coil domain-containing protein 180 [Sciurus carolinensis]